ncbi:uncharacterized protein LOC124885861 [Capsicum annuum]|uniref:uncharacterized protein LOC124885861 n=1 Tax=Capsicum annuum TaxID=4072 RepID=UPI001FB0A372|nr:uncharacterized protein LOC124885861 [Capsicum annuum]
MSLEKYFRKVSKICSTSQNQSRRNEDVDQIEILSQSSQRQKFDVNDLKADPAERPPILSYPPNIRDEIRRAYILKRPCQPQDHEFPQTDFSGTPRRFVSKWFDEYSDWLEHSVSADAVYCLSCYLFQGESIHQGDGNTFSTKEFKNGHKKDSFATHIGPPNSIHNQSKKKCEDLMREEQSIEAAFYKLDEKSKNEYRVRLNASIDVVRFLLNQGLALRGHDESESSLNKEKAPKNNKMISHDIQKDIVTACKIETIKAIIKDLDGEFFALLIDESRDKKEQDIANAMILVKVAKRRLQALRDNEWDPILKKMLVGIRSKKRSRHFLQELNDRFNEVTSDFLNGVACLNPIDTFSSFDIQKILVMAKLYPDDFDEFNMRVLENQLVNYIFDVCDIDKRFSNLGGFGELSRKLVDKEALNLSSCISFSEVCFASTRSHCIS